LYIKLFFLYEKIDPQSVNQHRFLDAFQTVQVATIVSTQKAAGEFRFRGFAI